MGAVPVGLGVAARWIRQSFFALSQRAEAEIFDQVAIAAFFTVEEQGFQGFLPGEKQFVDDPLFPAQRPASFEDRFDRPMHPLARSQKGPVEKVKRLF